MYNVMTVKQQTSDGLVCGTRAAERIAGAALSGLALVLAWGISTRTPSLLGMTAWLVVLIALAVFGLYVALSSRHFVLRPGSQTCTARINVFAVIRRRQEITFSRVKVHRRLNWQSLRWLYVLVLTDPQGPPDGARIMGYAGTRRRAERLARTIATYTETTAVDSDGQEMKDPCAGPLK